MSDIAYEILYEMNLPSVELIKLSDFEDNELKLIKPTRSNTEYCWTVTPSLPLFIIKKWPEISIISYIDADCFFFSNPEKIFIDFNNHSVLIIGHRYSIDKINLLSISGKYNVGLVLFRNDKVGIQVLEWWRHRCIEWCYNKNEDGKLGDQHYLNDWPTRFERVLDYSNIGACVAPWNIWNYKIKQKKQYVYVNNKPLIFYHFHALRLMKNNCILPAVGYDFSSNQINLIYHPYEKTLQEMRKKVQKYIPKFNYGITDIEPINATINEKIKYKKLKKLKTEYRLLFFKRVFQNLLKRLSKSS